jgi:hypothetical protein
MSLTFFYSEYLLVAEFICSVFVLFYHFAVFYKYLKEFFLSIMIAKWSNICSRYRHSLLKNCDFFRLRQSDWFSKLIAPTTVFYDQAMLIGL